MHVERLLWGAQADLYFYFTQREDSLFPSLASGGKMDARELVDTVMKEPQPATR